MVFFIYQLGSLASVWAISNLIKKDLIIRLCTCYIRNY